MSSTTRTRAGQGDRPQRGQVLVIFAISAVAFMMLAALAFDVGALLVERRDQQNAADAAALAGARFLPGDTTGARDRALAIAAANGFDGVDTVEVAFGSWSPGTGFVDGVGSVAIEVRINRSQPALFAGVVGRSSWDVSSRAVAVNQSSPTGAFALLALHPSVCPAIRVEGSGTVISHGNIQVNSACTTGSGAFRVGGTGTLDLIAPAIGCNVVGDATSGGGVTQNDCNPANEGAPAVPDPYSTLGNPVPIPAMPLAMVRLDPATNLPFLPTTQPPSGCPGSSSPATVDTPRLCSFGGSHAGETWRVYPGYYPGGLNFGGGSFLLEPGLYYIGDGGFRVANAALTSVEPGGTTLGGGILIFNSTHPSDTTSPSNVVLQGGTAEVKLWPLAGDDFPVYGDYDRMVVFQDRAVTLQVEIHGGGSNSQVRGIIYAPTAHVLVRGNGGMLVVDQVISSSIEARGNGGTINVAYSADFLPRLRYAGLTE